MSYKGDCFLVLVASLRQGWILKEIHCGIFNNASENSEITF